MYTIKIMEKRGSEFEELCSFEDMADAITTFDDICGDYYRVMLVRNRSVLMQQLNLNKAD